MQASDPCVAVLASHRYTSINMLGSRFATLVLLRGSFGMEGIVYYGFNPRF